MRKTKFYLAFSIASLLALPASAQVKIQDDDTNFLTIDAPANLTSDRTYRFPDAPVNGQYLTTDGSGNMSWGVPTGTDNTKVPLSGGTMTGPLLMGAQIDMSDDGGTTKYKLINVATPTADNDAATKAYVDASGGGDATLANQDAIKGTGFATGTDSLKQLRDRIDVLEGKLDTLLAGVDKEPHSFDFNDLTGVAMSSTEESNIVLINGISSGVQVSVSGSGSPEFRICSDYDCSTVAHTWTSTATNVDSGEYLQVRLTSSASESTPLNALFTVGFLIVDWVVTTGVPKIAFRTSTTHTGALGGVAGADSICNTRASAAGLSGTFKAWISASDSVDPESTFNRSTAGYKMTNGTMIANSWADLTDGSIASNLIRDENGNSGTSTTRVWTDTNNDGTFDHSSYRCSSWTSTSGQGRYGRNDQTGSWSRVGAQSGCSSSYYLYCFEQ